MYRALFLVIAALVALLAVGCAAPAASSPADLPTTTPTGVETPATDVSPIASPSPQAGTELPADTAARAVAWLAGQVNVSAADLRLVTAEHTEWTDSCFGLGGPAESCLQAITPGWRIAFEAGGQQYEVRTDESGSSFRLAPQGS